MTDVDQCDYDLVADDNFVLGAVPGFDNVFVGVGWRGTGYKFAPWVGRVLFELALREGTVYDIGRFSPARFPPHRCPGRGIVMSRPSEQNLSRAAFRRPDGRRRGLRVRAGAPRLHQGRPVRAGGDPRRTGRAATAASRIPARRRRCHGRAHLLRAPQEAQGCRTGGPARGAEPAGRPHRQRDRRRGRRAGGREHLQHLVLRPGRPEAVRGASSASSTANSSAGRSRRASTW